MKSSPAITVVYDNFVSPPTYGDFISVVMLCRYFIVKKFTVRLLILADSFRNDWTPVADKIGFVSEQVKVAKGFLYDGLGHVEISEYNNVASAIKSCSELPGLMVFDDNFFSRRPIYHSAFNVLNSLLSEESLDFHGRFLLTRETLRQSTKPSQVMPLEYVAWHCRYNQTWGLDRNLDDDQFLNYLARVNHRFPSTPVLIVSDVHGCNHYKKLKEKYNLDLMFSKDYTNSFLEDCDLVLNSKFYFQYRGGGIGMVPIYSRVPYEIIDPCWNETSWRYPKFTSWAHANQRRYFSLRDLKKYEHD